MMMGPPSASEGQQRAALRVLHRSAPPSRLVVAIVIVSPIATGQMAMPCLALVIMALMMVMLRRMAKMMAASRRMIVALKRMILTSSVRKMCSVRYGAIFRTLTWRRMVSSSVRRMVVHSQTRRRCRCAVHRAEEQWETRLQARW